jgi:hypothetical protein
MGLSINVGFLADLNGHEEGAQWFRDDMQRLNQIPISSGLQPHMELEDCPPWSADMFGYSGIHYLRRIAAHLNLRGSLPETSGESA